MLGTVPGTSVRLLMIVVVVVMELALSSAKDDCVAIDEVLSSESEKKAVLAQILLTTLEVAKEQWTLNLRCSMASHITTVRKWRRRRSGGCGCWD